MIDNAMQKLLDSHAESMREIWSRSIKQMERLGNVQTRAILLNSGRPLRDALVRTMVLGADVDPRVGELVKQMIDHPSIIPSVETFVKIKVAEATGASDNGD